MAIEEKVWGLLLDSLKEWRDENRAEHEEIKALLREQNGRIGTLERWRAGIVAVGAFVTIAYGMIFAWAKFVCKMTP
jgi:hypothetical protein